MIGLRIPEKYYQTCEKLRECADNKRSPKGRPITNDWVYTNYRNVMERLTSWLLDETVKMGYGTEFTSAALKVIGYDGRTVTLEKSDNPFDCFWTLGVIEDISDHYRFGGLLERWDNDP